MIALLIQQAILTAVLLLVVTEPRLAFWESALITVPPPAIALVVPGRVQLPVELPKQKVKL